MRSSWNPGSSAINPSDRSMTAPTNERRCYLCGEIVRECMGSVHAGSFLAWMLDPTLPVYELYPHCASFFANTLVECDAVYPQPNS